MKIISKYSIIWVIVCLALNFTIKVNAQYKVLHHFTGGANDGSGPLLGKLIQSDSILYGMTSGGGSNDIGTIFKIKYDGTGFRVLHSFVSVNVDGQRPYGSLLQDGSIIYGMVASENTNYGGKLFRVNSDGTSFLVLRSFTGGEGKWPYDTPVQSGSTLYGFNTYGGINTQYSQDGNGTIFRISKDGTGFRVLYTFTGGNDGGAPHCSPIQLGSTLYGTTLWGGSYNNGTIFKIDTNGTGFQVLHHFTGSNNNGGGPYGTTLVQSGSTFYGMTKSGGSGGNGTIFKMNINGGSFVILHSFRGGNSDGRQPFCGSLVLSDSTLYGMTTSGGINNDINTSGVVFKININGAGFQVLHSFAGGTDDGSSPWGSLLVFNSVIYGMTSNGGINNRGVIFALNISVQTGIEENRKAGSLDNFELDQNFPNPFNPSTTLHYTLGRSSQVKLAIYNLLGQKIKTLVNSFQSAGEYSLVWDARDDSSYPVSSGMYFYHLEADNLNFQKKMILVR